MDKQEWADVRHTSDACALAGAAAFFAGIPDAKVLINGPLWCYFYAMRRLDRWLPQAPQQLCCSQPDNAAVVYGTEACLMEAFEEITTGPSPSVLLLENSCSIGLIGDDLKGIARQAGLPFPVVCLDSGGLSGNYWDGYRAAAKAYFQKMPLDAVERPEEKCVNLIGLSDTYYHGRGDKKELEKLLASIGVKVLAMPGAGSNVDEIRQMRRAELNIVVHAELGEPLAQLLQEQYGMPYCSLLPPYGVEGTAEWLRMIAERLWLGEGVRQTIEQQRKAAETILRQGTVDAERMWGALWYERAVIAAPISVAVGLGAALRRELADFGSLTVMAYGGNQLLLTALPLEVDTLLSTDAPQGEELLRRLHREDLLLSSGAEYAVAGERGDDAPVMVFAAAPVNHAVNLLQRPAMGFEGFLQVAETLWNTTIRARERLSETAKTPDAIRAPLGFE